jgi:DNA-binding MarR family transcriptional regulator
MRIIMTNDDETLRGEGLVLRGVLRLARQMRQAAEDGELSGGALALLGTLYRGGSMSAVELARREGLQPQSLSRMLAQLDKSGLITRTTDAADARRHVIAITPAGTSAFMQQILRRRDWLADRMAERLSAAERSTLIEAAELMLRMAT